MSRSPFLDDPLEQMSKHIAAAVASPVEEARAMHIRAAEHLSQLARENGVSASHKRTKFQNQPKTLARSRSGVTRKPYEDPQLDL
jgi:hypothetical protein